VLFLAPVIVTAWHAGMGPAVLCMVLGAVLGDKVLLDPTVPLLGKAVCTGLFGIECTLIASFICSRRKAEETVRQLIKAPGAPSECLERQVLQKGAWGRWSTAAAAAGITVLFAGFEAVKEIAQPTMTKWQSHGLSMVAVGIISSVVLYRMRGVIQGQLQMIVCVVRELRQREAESGKQALVASHTHDAVILLDDERRIEWVNGAFGEITGLAGGAILGREFAGVLAELKCDEAGAKRVLQGLATEEGGHVEPVEIGLAGGERWLSLEVLPVQGAGRDLARFIVIARGITRRKNAEAAAEEATRHRQDLDAQIQAAARSIKELMNEMVTTQRFDRRFANLVPVRCREGKNCGRTTCPAYHGEGEPKFREVGGTFCDGTMEGRFAGALQDGRTCRVHEEARSHAIFELGESFNSLLAIVEQWNTDAKGLQRTEVELRKAMKAAEVANEELRRSQEMLQLVLDNIPQRVFWKDKNLRYLGGNQRVAQDAGVENPAALAGKDDYDLSWRSMAERYRSDDQQVMDSDTAKLDFEEPQGHSGDRIRWLRTSKIPLHDREGNVTGVMGTYEDITERKESEEAIRRAQAEAVRANRAKSEFLANMSHEIRTPMTAIIGYANELLEPGQSTDERLNCVNIIRRNGEHLLAVINDILDLSKIEAGKMNLESIACSPCRILCEVASLMRIRATEKQLSFEVKVEGPIPKTITSDPIRLKQILINLIGNAIKFTERGGVRLVVKLLEGPARGPGHLQYDVIDTGIGLSAEQMAGLFEPFQQADTSTTRRFGGSGLGLVISRHFAEKLGGGIGVRSVLGQGSTFTVTVGTGLLDKVPLVECWAEGMSHEAARAPAAVTQLRGRVLLAEDGRDNQRLLAAYLRRSGLEVTVADNGRIACEKAAAATAAGAAFDLVLMDMQMPELDGYGATAKLRNDGFATPIVALTAHAMAEDREKCLRAGCTDYLSKPVKRDDLLAMVTKYIMQAAAAGEAAKTGDEIGPKEVLRSACEDDPVLTQFLPEFVAGLPEQVSKVVELLAKEDLEGLGKVVHQLKGTGGLYGFMRITEQAQAVEAARKNGEGWEEVKKAVDALVALIRRVEGYVRTKERV
jgi:PAS domain S-box-containing protein